MNFDNKRLEEITAQALENTDNNRYVLAKAVGIRASQLSGGKEPLIDIDVKTTKFADIAIMELAEGKLKAESLI